MPSDFAPVLVLMLIAALVAVAIPVLSSLLGPRRPDPVKQATYECGVAEIDSVRRRTFIRYYLTALLFIVFDIEIAFLYPWAVVVRRFDAKLFVFGEMMLFLGVLLIAYAWVWRKGGLEWD
jgi:NADH-quinone oxidoreductase subunit A